MTEKEEWLDNCRNSMMAISVKRIKGVPNFSPEDNRMNGSHISLILNDPVTSVLKKTAAWELIFALHEPDKLKLGSKRGVRYCWKRDTVINLCLRELSELYDKEGAVPSLDAKDAVFKKTFPQEKAQDPPRQINMTISKEFNKAFCDACEEINESKRSLIEPFIIAIIDRAKHRGLI